jgi:hypothetical protein
VAVIIWWVDLQLPMHSVPITTDVLMLWFRISIWARCTTLCDKVCQTWVTWTIPFRTCFFIYTHLIIRLSCVVATLVYVIYELVCSLQPKHDIQIYSSKGRNYNWNTVEKALNIITLTLLISICKSTRKHRMSFYITWNMMTIAIYNRKT